MSVLSVGWPAYTRAQSVSEFCASTAFAPSRPRVHWPPLIAQPGRFAHVGMHGSLLSCWNRVRRGEGLTTTLSWSTAAVYARPRGCGLLLDRSRRRYGRLSKSGGGAEASVGNGPPTMRLGGIGPPLRSVT